MNGSEPPLIGVTTYRQQARSGVWDVPASFLPAAYIDGVTLAGGVAALLPPQPVDPAVADRVTEVLDGLLITGGRDVDPALYGQDRHPRTDQPAEDRDRWELALLHAALRRGLPVLGICRGAQLLNVALGGTLHQHLPDVVGHTGHRAGEATFAARRVRTAPGSRLAGLIGDGVEGRCYHHQGIDRLGGHLSVCATDEQGAIEAVELPGPDFVVGVQWHPEETLDDVRLFTALVDAARVYASGRCVREN